MLKNASHLDLNSLHIFASVVETGGFTAAALRLGMAKAKVSIQVRRLENRLGLPLFHRSTRRVQVTAAGQKLYDDSRPLLEGLCMAMEELTAERGELSGTLRISCTVDHAIMQVGPAAARFSALHPALRIDLRTSDRIVDMIAEGIDLSIRQGWLRDSSLHAQKLGEFEQYVVASPDYVARCGLPQHPSELAQHDWVCLSLLPAPLTWSFCGADGEELTVQMRSRLRVDSTMALRALLNQNAGISILDQHSAASEISSGRLLRLLPGWRLPRGGTYAVYPSRQLPARVRAFIEFYRGELQD